jgi:hypothetical protein
VGTAAFADGEEDGFLKRAEQVGDHGRAGHVFEFGNVAGAKMERSNIKSRGTANWGR